MESKLGNFTTKKITRKEFIVYLGMIMLTVLGISSFTKSILKISPTKRTKKSAKTSYGSGAYGV